jgi:hypothetical protein
MYGNIDFGSPVPEFVYLDKWCVRSLLSAFKVFYGYFTIFIYQLFLLQGNILYIFIVFVVIFLWHVKFKRVKSCSSSATIYEPGARSTLPLDGAALLLLFTLLVTAILHC